MKGGVALSKGNPSCLRFSLEESVWFQRGQEVLDLISISLDPDILIQEDEQYVTIQGALELTGEYKRSEIEIKEEEDVFTAPKFIQIVEEREEGICEFNHFFPVDITIPKNRIEHVEDIDVKVESFDYVFPERSCLKLTANLLITGLYGEQQHSAVNKYEEEKEEEKEAEAESHEVRVDLAADKETNEEDYQPFKVEARKQSEQVKDVPSSEGLLNQAKVVEEIEEEPVEVKVPVATMRNQESSTSSIDIFSMPKAVESSGQESEKMDESPNIEESPSTVMKEEAHELEAESPKEEVKPKKKTKKKSMSLTEFFARKEEVEVAKLKVCIVQNGDTVDMIAERYDIPVLQLLKVNHLEINHDIKEGQVLYIPVAVVR